MPTTLEKFVEDYNGAPLALEEFAQEATQVTNCLALSKCAQQFLDAQKAFEQALRRHHIEIG